MGCLYFLTFGQAHRHKVNGFSLGPDVVCGLYAESYGEARRRAFSMFGAKWCFIYPTLKEARLEYYPLGLVVIDLVN